MRTLTTAGVVLFALMLTACGRDPLDVSGRSFTMHVTVTQIREPCGGEPGKTQDAKVTFNENTTLKVDQEGAQFESGEWTQEGDKLTMKWTSTYPVTSNGEQVGTAPVSYAADVKVTSEKAFSGTGTSTALWCISDLAVTGDAL